MFQVRRSKAGNRRDSGRFDFLIIVLIALLLVAGLIYVLFQIIGHSEEHVDKVRKTKVIYKESLRWRPDSELCERRISKDLADNPNRKRADYTDLTLNEEAVKLIGRMVRLKDLNLDRSTLKDPWLEYLIPLPLQSLSLEGNQITDEAIPYILKMENLQRLSIGDTEVTDKGLEKLSEHGSLTTLKLNLARCVTNDGITHVGKMKQLTSLELTNPTSLTGNCLINLANKKNLRSLCLDNMPLTPEDLRVLSSCKHLTNLELANCQLKDPSMVELSKISSLQILNLTGNSITGNGLMALTKLSKLYSLKVKDCPDIDEIALENFRSALPRCSVKHSRASSLSEKMKRTYVKQNVDFLEDEVRQEMEKVKNTAE